MFLRIFLFIIGLIFLNEAKSATKRNVENSYSSHPSHQSYHKVRTRREISNPEGFLKIPDTLEWNNLDLKNLHLVVEQISDPEVNITVVGWQQIHDSNQEIEEIRSIQLVIPAKNPLKEDPVDLEEAKNIERFYAVSYVDEAKEILKPLISRKIPASLTFEEFEKDGERSVLLYMNKNEMFGKNNNFTIYNKTVIASTQEIENFIKSLQPTLLGDPSILRYDVDGKLIADQSKIQDYFLAKVISQENAPKGLVISGAKMIARIHKQYPEKEVARKLAEYLSEIYPTVDWKVFVDPEIYFIRRDMSLTLEVGSLMSYYYFDDASKIKYFVIGNVV